MKKPTSARDVVLEVLYRVDQRDAYVDISLDSFLDRSGLARADRALATEIAYGVCRRRNTLDWAIESVSSRPVARMDAVVRNALRMGVYQMMYLDRIPTPVAVSETVELVKGRGRPGSGGFVNGVLRALVRGMPALRLPEMGEDPTRHLALKHSHPEWLVEHFASELGQSDAVRVMETDNLPPPFTIRANTLRVGPVDLAAMLCEGGTEVKPCRYAPEGLILPEGPGEAGRRALNEGLAQPQDEGSMLVARVLDPRPGECVIDACSAPGGKTTHIAQLMGNSGRIVAADIHRARLGMVRDGCRRLGVTIVETIECDSRNLSGSIGPGVKADRILVDAPCSGLGTLRRRPDARWRKDARDGNRLAVTQMEMLRSAAGCLRPGGVMVYSTCTIGRRENQDVIAAFLDERDDFACGDIRPHLPGDLAASPSGEGWIQLTPARHDTDGFFICRLERSGGG